jgi:hypothetical protein
MQFTSAFAISGTINLPVILGTLLFCIGLVNLLYEKRIDKKVFCIEHVLILIFLFFVLFSYSINGGIYAASSTNHLLAYCSSFLLFFTGPLLFLFQVKSDFKLLFKITLTSIFWCVILSSSFSLLEFIDTNFIGLNIAAYIPRYAVQEYDPLILGFLIRSRGFSEESGHYSFMIGILGPLTYYYLFKTDFLRVRKVYKIILLWVIILSVITSFSVSSFLIIPLCIFIAVLLNINKAIMYIKNNYYRVLVTIFTLSTSVIIFNTRIPILDLLYITVIQKFDSFSFDDRKFRSDFFQNTFYKLPIENKLFGVGPSGVKLLGYDDSFTFLSIYQTITFEIGIVALCLLLLVIGMILVKNHFKKKSIYPYFFVSICTGVIHYNSISNYWYPFLWFTLAFCLSCNYKSFNAEN